jgi:electron transfer flavoprotein beta subunit
MKVISDPEVPLSLFKLDRENRKQIPPVGTSPLFSPFDENALEAALKIKDRMECTITLLSMGKSIPKALIQKAMALGVDDAVAIEGPEFEDLDAFTTIDALVNAIKKMNPFDLIFTGRQSADWDAGLVWAGIAERLDIPSLTIARKATIQDSNVIVERCVSDGIETIEANMPALVTFSSEVGESRYVSIPELMKAKKRKYTTWSAPDVDILKTPVMDLIDLFEPDLGNFDCHFIAGENDEEKGRNLAKTLLKENLL